MADNNTVCLFHEIGGPLEIAERPRPEPQRDGVVVSMQAAPVLSYMQRVLDGRIPYMLPPAPFVPGTDAIGEVVAVGADVTDLEPGTRVHAGPLIRSHAPGAPDDTTLIGLTGLAPDAVHQQQRWPDGAFASYVHYPRECVTPLHGLEGVEPDRLASLLFFAVAAGGLGQAGLTPGRKLIIGGATGHIGSHAVLLGLTMGASRIVPMGRNRARLQALEALDPARVRPAPLAGDSEADTRTIMEAADGAADHYLDIVGGGSAEPVASALRALRKGGEAALMGALAEPIPIAYAEIMLRELTLRGNFMYARDTVAWLAELMRSGVLDPSPIEATRYRLTDANEAIAAADGTGGLSTTVLVPA